MTSLSRRGVTALGVAAAASAFSPRALAAAGVGGARSSVSAGNPAEFETLYDLQQAKGLSGTVWTKGDEYADDGSGVTYSVADSRPSGRQGSVSVRLADGRWAVPQTFPTRPARGSMAAAAEDLVARGQSFVDAGTQLGWDGNGTTPLTGEVVHQVSSAPYAVSCSTFVGMAVVGWDYHHTTYVANRNTTVGYHVDFGDSPENLGAWQANNLASWFYARGDLWLDSDNHYERGDIMFFSDPDRAVATSAGRGMRSTFGNVYHTAIYLGDDKLMHSTGTAAGQGVHVSAMWSFLKEHLSFVARPQWRSA